MAKRQFSCEVTRIDRFTVEIDDEKIDEAWMADFREEFYEFYTLEEHAKHIARSRARFGAGFIEGYGQPFEEGQSGGEDCSIKIIVDDEDNDCEIDVAEITSYEKKLIDVAVKEIERADVDTNWGCY